MKRLIALLLVVILLIIPAVNTSAGESPTTPTDLEPIEPPVEPDTPTIPDEPPTEDTGPPISDFTPSLLNLNQFNIVALHDFTMRGHIRNSVWVGGTMTGESYMFVDDGSIGGSEAHTSYVYNNQSEVQFKGRTSGQSSSAYMRLSDDAVTSNANYWYTIYKNLGNNNETCIYVPASENGIAYIHGGDGFPRYQCEGSDESSMSSNITYWTDAATVDVIDICGFIIAPSSKIILHGNNRISVVGNSVVMDWTEIHINSGNPTIIDPTPTPTPQPTPTPTPIIVTKELKGEIWQVRCDTMDNTTFTAGGGRWYADISNWENKTSKEGHRSNHCGNWDNWVLFVNEEGQATSLYQLKSGSTGGTLPSIMYRAPADLASIPEGQLVYDPTDPNDTMTQRLINEVFIPSNVMPFSEINLQEGQRLFWISQNGKQVWHHTGVLRKTHPRFTIVVNGTQYMLGVGESVEISAIEEGLLEIDEIATANYQLKEVQDDGEGHYTVINEIVTPPPKNTPTPPPPVVTPTPTPTPTGKTPTPTPTPTSTPTGETPTPTPTESSAPSPTPVTYCNITIKKIVDQFEGTDPVIFYFKITGVGLNEPLYVEVAVDPQTGIGSETITGLKAGKYTVEEVDVPDGYILISEGSITKYYKDDGGSVQFENQFVTPTPSPTTSPTPSPTLTPTPSPTPTPTPSPTPTPTSSPTPTPTATPSPTPTATPTATPTQSPSPTPSPTPRIEDGKVYIYAPKPSTTPRLGRTPKRTGDWYTFEDYGTPLGVAVIINHCGDCFD